jgi:hypothetical protein
MDKQKLDDKVISSLVQSVKYKIPDSVEEHVNAHMAKLKDGRTTKFRRSVFWYPLSAVAMLIIVFLLIFQPFVDKESFGSSTPITEIKTEFQLTDKNIKILWIQKKEFQLRINK